MVIAVEASNCISCNGNTSTGGNNKAKNGDSNGGKEVPKPWF